MAGSCKRGNKSSLLHKRRGISWLDKWLLTTKTSLKGVSMRMKRGELSCRAASSCALFAAFPVSVCTVCEEAGGGGGVAFTMSVCRSLLYITQQYAQSSSSLLPSTAGPNNRSIVLPEIKTSTIVAVENNASYWRHDVTWRVRDWRACPRNGHRWFENFIAVMPAFEKWKITKWQCFLLRYCYNDTDNDDDNGDYREETRISTKRIDGFFVDRIRNELLCNEIIFSNNLGVKVEWGI